MLSRFNIIVAIDEKYGISKDGLIPWKNNEDIDFFRCRTIGNGNNTVIMGRKTYEAIPHKFSPLSGRRNIVVTSQTLEKVECVRSLFEGLKSCNNSEEVYVIGGQDIFEEALDRFAYLCDKILVSQIAGNYNCDRFFAYDKVKKLTRRSLMTRKATFVLETFLLFVEHPEQRYLKILDEILEKGEVRKDRTGVGTRSMFNPRMEFDLRQGFPLLTTKRTWFDGIKKELLFFISGKTDTKILENQGVNIWKDNTTQEFLDKNNLSYEEGDMGPGYSFQWRHAGGEYEGCHANYDGKGIDQLKDVIERIKTEPFGRRLVVSAWNVVDIPKMALPPCHCFFQFYVGCHEGVPTYLDCALYQRSSDMFLGVPFNIASYALLMHIIGNITGLIPRKFIHDLGDAHIYLNHIEQVKEQLTRTPHPFPEITISRKLENIDDVKPDDIILKDYHCWPSIKGSMAI